MTLAKWSHKNEKLKSGALNEMIFKCFKYVALSTIALLGSMNLVIYTFWYELCEVTLA